MKLDPNKRADYLTKKELAKEWGCSVNDIDYLIYDQNELRLAAKTSESPITGLYRYYFPDLELWSGLSRIFEDMDMRNSGADFYSSHFSPQQGNPIPKSEITLPSIREDLPRFLYRVFFNDRTLFTAEDIQGIHYYMLTGWCVFDASIDSYFDPEYLCLSDRYFQYITMEEKERFELETGMQYIEEGLIASPLELEKDRGVKKFSSTTDTDRRNQEVQEKMNQLAIKYSENGKHWTKEKLAYEIFKSGEFPNLTSDRILRITTKPKL